MMAELATISATKFLKKAFCMVGKSPEILTKKVIREKPKAAKRIKVMPLILSFLLMKYYPF